MIIYITSYIFVWYIININACMDNTLNGLDKGIIEIQDNIDTLTSNYEQAQIGISKPFEREEELNIALLRQKELTRELDLSIQNNSEDIDMEL